MRDAKWLYESKHREYYMSRKQLVFICLSVRSVLRMIRSLTRYEAPIRNVRFCGDDPLSKINRHVLQDTAAALLIASSLALNFVNAAASSMACCMPACFDHSLKRSFIFQARRRVGNNTNTANTYSGYEDIQVSWI
jgi:hypothetical protein